MMREIRIFCCCLLFLIASGCSFRRKSYLPEKQQGEASLAQKENIAVPSRRAGGEEEIISISRKVSDKDHAFDDTGDAAQKRKTSSRKRDPHEQDSIKSDVEKRRSQAIPVNEHMVKVAFEDEDLATMLNHFAALQKRNLVLPQGADAIKQKITFKLSHAIPLRAVDEYLDMFLDLAGYSRVPHGPVQRIVHNDSAVVREALPLYVGIDAKELPNTDERIRVIYYLKNLRVPDTEAGSDPISAILSSVLSGSRSLTYDPRANAIIIADKANLIRAAMTLLLELDALGTRDIIRAMPLYNSSAGTVADIITKQVIAMGGEEQGLGAKGDAGRYFSSSLRVMPDARTNALIIMGREPAVERVQEFIREYIDVPTDQGTSILHFYDLQFLDAVEFAAVLQRVVQEQVGLSGQAKQQASGGPVKYFENVVVVAEQKVAEASQGGGGVTVSGEAGSATAAAVQAGDVYRGGNRLVITALKDDWRRIESLIRQLDQPKLQVLVQVLIVDLSITDNVILATQMRNPSWMQLPPGFAFQSAQLANPILDGPIQNTAPPFIYTNPTTVAADLLRLLSGNLSAAAGVVNTPGNIGSMILSFNDPSSKTPGIWAFMQWLDKFFTTKILQHPYLVVQNYADAEEYISQIQRVPGPSATGEGGAISTKLVDIPAAIRVAVTPRASSVDRVNLRVAITIDQFIGTQANRATRQLQTNVNLNSGDILVLGGLTSYEESVTESETPILGSIPLLKWFFTNKERNLVRTNLVAFVSPTIIEPRIPDGINAFTVDETHRNYKIMKQDQLLSQLKEPISYLFFDDGRDDLAEMLDEYLAVGKGDFVYDDIGVIPQYSNHKCSPCTKVEELAPRKASCGKQKCSPRRASPCGPLEADQKIISRNADRVKKQLAAEENPLVSSVKCNTCPLQQGEKKHGKNNK